MHCVTISSLQNPNNPLSGSLILLSITDLSVDLPIRDAFVMDVPSFAALFAVPLTKDIKPDFFLGTVVSNTSSKSMILLYGLPLILNSRNFALNSFGIHS